jgi:hypothetical protein
MCTFWEGESDESLGFQEEQFEIHTDISSTLFFAAKMTFSFVFRPSRGIGFSKNAL